MSQRYQREIEEILQQAGKLGKGSGPGRSGRPLHKLVWLQISKALGGKLLALTAGRVMLLALVLLLTALLLGAALPAGVPGLMAWGGLILFIVGYAMFFIRPGTVEKRWRGQSIEYGTDSLWARLRRRFR